MAKLSPPRPKRLKRRYKQHQQGDASELLRVDGKNYLIKLQWELDWTVCGYVYTAEFCRQKLLCFN